MSGEEGGGGFFIRSYFWGVRTAYCLTDCFVSRMKRVDNCTENFQGHVFRVWVPLSRWFWRSCWMAADKLYPLGESSKWKNKSCIFGKYGLLLHLSDMQKIYGGKIIEMTIFLAKKGWSNIWFKKVKDYYRNPVKLNTIFL